MKTNGLAIQIVDVSREDSDGRWVEAEVNADFIKDAEQHRPS